MQRTLHSSILHCVALLSLALRSDSQAPEITIVMPPGGPRGGATTIRITGKNLQSGRLIVSGAGVAAQSFTPAATGDSADVRLNIAAGAAIGERELRVVSPNGVSGPASLWVDVHPNLIETEPNDSSAQAVGPSPTVLNGAIQAAGDRDAFAFDLKQGDTWVADANVARIHSPLGAVIALADESGRDVAEGRAAVGGDQRIVYRCEKAGRYVLTVRDRAGRGGAEYVYRVAVGRLPVVTSVVPHGEKPGRKVSVQLSGVNLGAVSRTVVTIPADAPPGLFWSTVRTPAGLSLPFPLLVDFAPVVGLTETDALMPLPTLPCALEGVFSVYPSIRFAFQAAPKETLAFDLFTHSLGSDVDGTVRVTDLSGKELAASRLGGADARVEFTPPVEGVYVVEARESANRTGPDHLYRLSARRAEPDYRLYVNAGRLNLASGGTATVRVEAERLSGFDGPIQIAVTGLPRGVSVTGRVIPAGQATADVTFKVASDAPRTAARLTFNGSAQAAGKSLTHRAIPRVPAANDAGWRVCELLPIAVTGPAR
jgi:hypothetical protein